MITISKSTLISGWRVDDTHARGPDAHFMSLRVTNACDYVYQRMAVANQWWLWVPPSGTKWQFMLTCAHDGFDGLKCLADGGECIDVNTPQKIYHLLKAYLLMQEGG